MTAASATAAGKTRFYLPGTHDIFISHSWRYDQEWTDMVALLDEAFGLNWRNWSLPWHDPGLNRFSPSGHALLEETLEGQLSQCSAALILADVCRAERGPQWLRIQIDLAKKHGCPLLGVGAQKDGTFPAEFRGDMDAVVPWSKDAIVPHLKPLG